jgi:type I restriction enzyme S subunit
MSESTVLVPLRELAVDKGLVGGPFGSSLGSKDYEAVGVPVIRGQNLASSGYFDPSEFVFVSEEKVDSQLARNVALPGDVVFTQRGTLGQVGIVPTEPYSRYVISQSQMRIRVDRHLAEPVYVYYCFRDPRMLAKIEAMAITTGVPHINLGILGDLLVPKPPLSGQRAIVRLLRSLDDKIAINERIAYAANRLAKEHYWKEASQWSNAGEILLSDTARWYSGGTPSTTEPSYWNGDIPWISAASMKSTWIDSSDRMITRFGAENGTRMVPAETILFVVRGMSLKSEFRIGITQREVAFGQDCKALIAKAGIDPIYLFYSILCRTEQILGLVDEAGHGTGRLATDRLAALRIPLPSDVDQRRLVSKLRPLAGLAAARQRENRALAELRDTLLPKLISGELRIRDAERQVADVV